MKKVRIAMLLYVAVGLIPLAVLSRLGPAQAQREFDAEVSALRQVSEASAQSQNVQANIDFQSILRDELSREYTEYQHWRAPLNIQAQGPSVVRSPLAGPPRTPLIRFYFQVRCDGGELQFNTPHLADNQTEQLAGYQSAEPLPPEFERVVCAAKDSILGELPYIVSAQRGLNASTNANAPADSDVMRLFLELRSGAKPQSMQVVSNDVLIVNSNSQEVANRARSEQVQKKASRAAKEEDPWSGLKRPPGIDDPYGDSVVQIYPFGLYQRHDDQRRMLFWRTIRTPVEHIMQGFEIDLEYVRNTWLPNRFGGRVRVGSMFELHQPRTRSNVNYEELTRSYAAVSPAIGFATQGLGAAVPQNPDVESIESRFLRTRNNYLLLGAAYAALIAVLGLFLYRTVSRSEALAQQQGEFVAAVSHELRTPLTAMRLFTEMLIGQAKTAKNEKVEQHATRILAEEERLTRLVEMILLAAKIERGSFRVELANAPLADPLNAAIETALRAHVGREITLEAGDLPSVIQDRAAAQQVFFNLIDNALKYSRDAGKPVRITSETKDRNHYVRIIDQGAGIADADKPRLFMRFARGTKANEQGAGTGLGLWLTREYAKQMGWEVTLESKPGEGTNAVVSMPF